MTDRRREQDRILANMRAQGMDGRAVDDLWACDNGDCDMPDVVSAGDTPPACPHCGAVMLRVLVVGNLIVLSES